ncbi:polysaccharide pyruvyl transferase family protein [Pseudarthrobacter sp. NPDC092184]|uniref:polysaccharide pyruvyl transferase family protein n=1 Tax=unclassified Pseudarthrobacter TaxID=2647000 RepID=UPI00382E37DD
MTGKRILLLHCYSSANRGDGLLVDESLELIREVYGADADIEIVTSYPDSFAHLGLRTYRSKPSLRGYSISYLKLLITRFRDYEIVAGVGGGYLRFGTIIESLKTLAVMGPQLLAAAYSPAKTIYLPQSVGPARFGFRRPIRAILSRLDRVWVRDDRSAQEFPISSVSRASDLALLGMKRNLLKFGAELIPVVSVREHRGSVPVGARALAHRLQDFDGYVQSAVAGNDDSEAVASLSPRTILTFHELMEAPKSARIVVAVRLHAALMALSAGHYVVHLAYERKGFGAFEDLGLSDYVFNVHKFSVEQVEERVRELVLSPSKRAEYDSRIAEAMERIQVSRGRVLASFSSAANEIQYLKGSQHVK